MMARPAGIGPVRGPLGRTISLAARVIGWGEPPLAHESQDMQRHLSPWILIGSSVGLPLAAYGTVLSERGDAWAVDLFYLGLTIVCLFPAYVILRPTSSRLERIEAVAVLTAGLYGVRLLREPVAFIDHDEFLHWTTVNHLMETGRLFSPNALLPISPRYPGLEIVASSLVWLTGLSVFQAAQLVLFACRAVLMSALYFVYERVSGSPRIAAGGCLVYAGCSTFLVFDTQFSYESLAIAFVAASLLAVVRLKSVGRVPQLLFILAPLIAALAVTHHMTAFFAAALFVGLAVLELVTRPGRRHVASSFAVAAGAVLVPLAWSRLMGNPGADYLGPVLSSGFNEASHLLQFSAGRTLFVSTDGYVAPLWQRLVALGSVALTCLGLAVGFFRALALAGLRSDAGFASFFRRPSAGTRTAIILFVLLTLAFPVSVLFRLTKSGWEIGNRMGPFSFIGVALVVAVGAMAFVAMGRWSGLRANALVAAALVVLTGGVISSEGPRLLVPQRFKVSSDSASIGPMAIDAATWARDRLGERNLFSADRINRLLLSTYGRQDVASTLQDGYDTSDAVLSAVLGAKEKAVLRKVGIDYLTVDMRLSMDLPGVGVYFDGGAQDHDYVAPPDPDRLLKFEVEPAVGKVFDDGSIFIYDLRALDGTR